MALEILTIGASVGYAVETTAGTRPTTNYTVLPDINSAPEIGMDSNPIDVSNMSDTITRYASGRLDPGGNVSFVLNHTEAAITAWETFVSAAKTGKAAGKATWVEYKYPGATKSAFWKCEPQALGIGALEQNSLDTIPAPAVFGGYDGDSAWDTASTTSP